VRLLFLAVLFPLLGHAEPATVIRATELKSEPATDASTVAQLPENTAVEALDRQGGWTRVKAAAGEGWVKMLALRYGGSGGTKKGDSGMAQIFNVARTGSSGTQVTTGVRGLDEEKLANAQPNAAELAKLDKFAAEPGAAAGFAAKGKLAAQPVSYPQ
jgi:SH3 domain-containing protein